MKDCLFFLSVTLAVDEITRTSFCRELSEVVSKVTDKISADAAGLVKVTLVKAPNSFYLETDFSASQNLQVTAHIFSHLPSPFEVDNVFLYLSGKNAGDFAFQASTTNLLPGQNVLVLTSFVTIPAGEYIIERATLTKGQLHISQSLLGVSKYILKVTENRSTLQILVTEPDRCTLTLVHLTCCAN